LYVFVIDTLPTGRIVQCLPLFATTKRWFHKSVHIPLRTAREEWRPFLKFTGLHMGEWTLFSGIPTHENHGYTAVIRYQKSNNNNNNTVEEEEEEVRVWQSPNWTASSWLEREQMVWKDSYYYYIWNDNDAVTSFPILTTFMEHLARTYSPEGSIEYDEEEGRLVIYPNNTLLSISVMMHNEIGEEPPEIIPSSGYNWWTQPVQRSTTKHSECLYYWKFVEESSSPADNNTIQYYYKYMDYEFDENVDLDTQTGCRYYNHDDTPHHMIGSYDLEKRPR